MAFEYDVVRQIPRGSDLSGKKLMEKHSTSVDGYVFNADCYVHNFLLLNINSGTDLNVCTVNLPNSGLEVSAEYPMVGMLAIRNQTNYVRQIDFTPFAGGSINEQAADTSISRFVDASSGPDDHHMKLFIAIGTNVGDANHISLFEIQQNPGALVSLADAVGSVGETLISDGLGPDMGIKGIVSGDTSITIATVGGDIDLQLNPTTFSAVVLSNAGVGESLVVDGVGPTLSVKGIVSTDGSISVGTTGNDIDLQSGLSSVNADIDVTGATVELGKTGSATSKIMGDWTSVESLAYAQPNKLVLTTSRDIAPSSMTDAEGSLIVGNIDSGTIINPFVNTTILGTSTTISPPGASLPNRSVLVGSGLTVNSNIDSSVIVGQAGFYQGSYQVGIGHQQGQMSGDYNVAIGHLTNQLGGNCVDRNVVIGNQCAASVGNNFSNVIAIGDNCINGGQPVGDNAVYIGKSCASDATVGRLHFGNAMEAPRVATPNANQEELTALIPIKWNGTLYYLPALSSAAYGFSKGPMPLGEVKYFDAVGFTELPDTDIGDAGMVFSTNSSIGGSSYFSSPVAGRLQYDGPINPYFHIAVSISGSTAGTNQQYRFGVYVNGVLYPGSEFDVTGPSSSNPFSAAYHIVVRMTAGDYITLRYSYVSATNDITFRNVNIMAMGDKATYF